MLAGIKTRTLETRKDAAPVNQCRGGRVEDLWKSLGVNSNL